jgi:putative transposase
LTPNPKKKGEAPMEVYISVPKVVSIFEERQTQLEKPFEMISIDIRQSVGGYLSELMEME